MQMARGTAQTGGEGSDALAGNSWLPPLRRAAAAERGTWWRRRQACSPS